MYASGANKGFDHSIEAVKAFIEQYEKFQYYQVSDNYDAKTFQLSGIRLDLQLFFNIGLKLFNEDYFPKWYDNSEFKAARK
ncbi:hypothetical protein ES044_12945 [Polaribacter sp. IC066]|uniref:hypothetical protein n=1 Tax=Polaribacter sp. IC066 TaxID=57032 RepID=UPI0011BD6300|nr:hypothetical protein [Polaribacter sp. IC066]TXD58169.1 hypothetical protein ES044_12945 [Polaribacter sp. IC066]